MKVQKIDRDHFVTVHEASAVWIDTGFGATVYVGPAMNLPGKFIVRIDPVQGEATDVVIEHLQGYSGQFTVGIDPR